MSAIKRIHAATDFSELGNEAVRRAAIIAAREDAELLVTHAFPRQSAFDAVFAGEHDLQDRMRALAEENLAAQIKAAQSCGATRARGEILTGSARRVLAETSDIFRPDLWVIGAHGSGLLQQFLLGGTAAHILNKASCPVLVTRRAVEGDYRRALAAVDLGPRSEAVLRAALIVAKHAGVKLLHAYAAPFEAKLRNKRFPETEIKRLAEREFLVAQRNLDALLADPELVGIDIESELSHGKPNTVAPDAARALGADVIVVGRHGGGRIRESLIGSVPRFLAYYAPCDVLVV